MHFSLPVHFADILALSTTWKDLFCSSVDDRFAVEIWHFSTSLIPNSKILTFLDYFVIGSFRPAKFKICLLLVVFWTTGLRVQTIEHRIKLTPISSKLAFDALSGAKFTDTSDGACDCRPKPKLRCLTNFLLFLESWLAADEAIESLEDFRSTSAFCKQNEYRTISGNSFNQPFWVFIPERAFAQSAWIYLLVTELEGGTDHVFSTSIYGLRAPHSGHELKWKKQGTKATKLSVRT